MIDTNHGSDIVELSVRWVGYVCHRHGPVSLSPYPRIGICRLPGGPLPCPTFPSICRRPARRPCGWPPALRGGRYRIPSPRSPRKCWEREGKTQDMRQLPLPCCLRRCCLCLCLRTPIYPWIEGYRQSSPLEPRYALYPHSAMWV